MASLLERDVVIRQSHCFLSWRSDKPPTLSDKWQTEETSASTLGARNLKAALDTVKQRISRLLDLYLDGDLEQAEFQQKKNALMERKAELAQKIADFELNGHNWLEPLRNWVIEASNLDDIARASLFSL